MTVLTIASQLDAETNQYLQLQLPEHQVITIQPGDLTIPEEAKIFIVRPINVRGKMVSEPPAGWPWSLDWIQVVSSGIDFYPDWLFQGAPQVTTGKGANANYVAEFALAAIFAAAKHFPELWVKDSNWTHSFLSPVQGSTVGILGLGSIGQALAHKAVALGADVIAYGRPGKAIADIPGVRAATDIHDLFSQADHLVIAAPLTKQSYHLINKSVLASAKPGLHLINVARGGLVDQEALLEALDNQIIARATLDVTEPEPLPDGHPLYLHPNVRISPHTSALSTNGKVLFIQKFIENLHRYQTGQSLNNLVDNERNY